MSRNVVVILDQKEGRNLVKRLCRKHGVRIAEFEELVQAQVNQVGKQRRRSMWAEFDDILDRMDEEPDHVS
ncbi:hypothetical protein MMSR116_16195 [Methylobacterium mesophilicum SR1.6/6]|uniref:Uncharacterized protein n=1 Tax=Methylobacterium mesophilicum SR1.6/6 TaxID=908290 RepID=A0A6B9FL34_9HYPH|nr:DNA modification system-associated small protein [Methylobacterium mesophilicum]QGY03253.1 hypothetical protein MMSR116_16195 [Methylobacterium mesophilicum SR1.6/6]